MNNRNIFAKVLVAGVTLVGAAFGIKKFTERNMKTLPEATQVAATSEETVAAQEVTAAEAPAEDVVAETAEVPVESTSDAEENVAEETDFAEIATEEDPSAKGTGATE